MSGFKELSTINMVILTFIQETMKEARKTRELNKSFDFHLAPKMTILRHNVKYVNHRFQPFYELRI